MSVPSSRHPHWWQWPTVLSLDAPAVALLWQALLARIAGVPLAAPRPFVLGASIWLAYSADRWFEGWRVAPEQIRTKRHYFYQRWRWPVAAGWVLVLIADLVASLRGLSRRELTVGLALLGLVLAYLLSHQLVHRHRRGRVPKEVCVACLLGAGVAVFIAPNATWAQLRPVAGLWLLFLFLCLANCALISVWENTVDQSQGQTSLARQFSWGAAFGRAAPWLAGLAAVLLWHASRGPVAAGAGAAGASGALLAVVDRGERRLGWAAARVLADVALLTPAIPLLWPGLLAGRV